MGIQIEKMDSSLAKYLYSFKQGEEIGEVHGVYDRVINILTKDEEHLISIGLNGIIEAPYMMQTSDMLAFSLLTQTLRPGDGVYGLNGSQISAGSSVIDYEKVETWNTQVGSRCVQNPESAEGKFALCAAVLEETTQRNGLLGAEDIVKNHTQEAPNPRITIHTQKFIELLEQLPPDFSPEVLAEFVGLGIGLTPSGDDFLTGLLTVWNCHQSSHFKPFSQEKEKWLSFIRGRTTTVGFYTLKNCLEGNVNGALYRVVTSPIEAASSHLWELLKLGSTSGTDTAIGVKYGYESLLEQKKV